MLFIYIAAQAIHIVLLFLFMIFAPHFINDHMQHIGRLLSFGQNHDQTT